MERVMRTCAEYLVDNIDLDTVLDIWNLAETYSLQKVGHDTKLGFGTKLEQLYCRFNFFAYNFLTTLYFLIFLII